jgi:hypothetical protein
MDIAVDLVESYLRLTGYLTVSELEVQRRADDGRYRTVTDIDIMALRLPGAVFIGDPHDSREAETLEITDPALALEEDMIDVIVGEVKQGEAELNPAIRDHAALHSMLRRIEWLYDEPIHDVITGLQQRLVHRSQSRTGGVVRTRIVAFGRNAETSETVISLSHIVSTMLGVFADHESAYRGAQFRAPAPAFLRLLVKAGFDIEQIRTDASAS